MQMIKEWVLLKPVPRETKKGSILLPDQLGHEKVGHSVGVIVKLPSEFWPKSVKTTRPVPNPGFTVGDHVMYRDFLKDIYTVEYEGAPHSILHWEDILAVVEPGTEIEG